MLVEIHVRDVARDPTLANAECGIEFLFIPNSEFRSRRTGLARYGRSQTSACRLLDLDRAPSHWHLARSGFATVVEYERIPRGRLLRAGLIFRSSCVSGGYNPEFAATLFAESTYMR